MKWPKRWDCMPKHDNSMSAGHFEWECVRGHHHYWLLAALWHNWRSRK